MYARINLLVQPSTTNSMSNPLTVPWDTCPIGGGQSATKDALQKATCSHLFQGDDGLYKLTAHTDKANQCTRADGEITAKPICYKLTSTDFKEPISNGIIENGVHIAQSDNCPSGAIPVFNKVEPSAKSCFEASLDTLTDAMDLTVKTCGKLSKVNECQQKSTYVLQMPGTFDVTTPTPIPTSAIQQYPPGYFKFEKDKYWDIENCYENHKFEKENECGFINEKVPGGVARSVQNGMIYKVDLKGELLGYAGGEFDGKCVQIKGDCVLNGRNEGAEPCMDLLYLTRKGKLSSSDEKALSNFMDVVDCAGLTERTK